MKIYAKLILKEYFFKMVYFFNLFLDILPSAISFNQIACDVMCVQYVCHNTAKKFLFFYKDFFAVDDGSY